MKQNIILSNPNCNGWVVNRIDTRDANKIVKTDETGKISKTLIGITGEIQLQQNIIDYTINFPEGTFTSPPIFFCSIYSNVDPVGYFTSCTIKNISLNSITITLSTPPPNSTDYKLVYLAI